MIWSVESRYVVPPFSEKVSESRTWWLPLVAALMLQREQSADELEAVRLEAFCYGVEATSVWHMKAEMSVKKCCYDRDMLIWV